MSDSSRPGAAPSPLARTTQVVCVAAAALVFAAACAMSAVPATAQTTSSGANASAASLRAEADQIASKYFAALARTQALDTEITEKKASIDDLEARAERAREAARERAVIAYRQSGSRLAAMVDGDDVLDAARRARLIDQVNAQDQATFTKLHNLSEALRQQRKDLEASRVELSSATAALKTQADAIDTKLAEAAKLEAAQKVAATNATTATGATSSTTGGSVAPAATTSTAPTAPTTTTTAPPTTVPTPPTNPVPPPEPPAGAHPHHDDPFLTCVRARESGGYYGAVSPGGLYRGAYQFAQTTWNATANHAGRPALVGVQPNVASVYDQDDMAWTLYQWQGMGPWGGACP